MRFQHFNVWHKIQKKSPFSPLLISLIDMGKIHVVPLSKPRGKASDVSQVEVLFIKAEENV
jgi:hypothetical protein